jgi:hypothetical protein
MYRELSDLGLFVQTCPYGLGLYKKDLGPIFLCMYRPVSSIYISGVRTSVIRSMRKVKPSETKMAAIDVQ